MKLLNTIAVDHPRTGEVRGTMPGEYAPTPGQERSQSIYRTTPFEFALTAEPEQLQLTIAYVRVISSIVPVYASVRYDSRHSWAGGSGQSTDLDGSVY